MRPGEGLGMGPGEGLGMGPGEGLGMGPGEGLGMGPGEGLGMHEGRSCMSSCRHGHKIGLQTHSTRDSLRRKCESFALQEKLALL